MKTKPDQRPDLTFVASEADNYAIEEALRLKKHNGEVVALSMGGKKRREFCGLDWRLPIAPFTC
jgi:electron transfer flavoprotein alpha/beta subunit